jgi:hypothetical protein
MNRQFIAGELVKVAKDLMAAPSSPSEWMNQGINRNLANLADTVAKALITRIKKGDVKNPMGAWLNEASRKKILSLKTRAMMPADGKKLRKVWPATPQSKKVFKRINGMIRKRVEKWYRKEGMKLLKEKAFNKKVNEQLYGYK